MAFTRKRIRIGECLLNENFITQEKLDEALALQKSSGKRLGELLVENGFVTGEQLATALSRQLGLGIVNLQVIEIPDDILRRLQRVSLPSAMNTNSFEILLHSCFPFYFSLFSFNLFVMKCKDTYFWGKHQIIRLKKASIAPQPPKGEFFI